MAQRACALSLACVLSLACMLWLAGCGVNAGRSSRARRADDAVAARSAVAVPAWVSDLQMISATTGWALLSTSNPALPSPAATELARTTDGGRTWAVVTPPAAAGALAADQAVLKAVSASRAYLAVGGASGYSIPAVGQTEVFATSDGGRSWRHSAPFPAAGPDVLDFDGAYGWLLDDEGAAMGQNPIKVYRSTDGGVRWSLVAQTASSVTAPPSASGLPVYCDKGSMAFRSPRVGWITGGCNELGVWVSSDGGLRWAVQALPLPASTCRLSGCSIAAPQFFGRTGYLAIWAAPQPELLLTSSDGGTSWQPLPLPPGADQVRVMFFSAASGLLVPLTAPQGDYSRVFYITADGGRRWVAVRQGRAFGSIAAATFDPVSATTLFAWNADAGIGGSMPRIYRSTDSGRTWIGFEPRLTAAGS
ncbi:MAG TPA: YCF48-related protein [Streptosporangiaceae bacterium]|nr:YCF48-related protein [Streptosporangiaceae bacterium]